jgi:hypothetical protein
MTGGLPELWLRPLLPKTQTARIEHVRAEQFFEGLDLRGGNIHAVPHRGVAKQKKEQPGAERGE